VLVYPATDLTLSHPSITDNGEGFFLTGDAMRWFTGHYGGDPANDPLVSPLHAPSHADLPPALVITAEFDPLRDEGEAYARKLEAAGVPTTLHRFDGQIHGFLGMYAMLDDGKLALDEIATAVRSAVQA
jgi:acetyl esterase